MGRQLMVDYPSFMANIQSMDKVLQSLNDDAPTWSIEGELTRNVILMMQRF